MCGRRWTRVAARAFPVVVKVLATWDFYVQVKEDC